MPKEKNSADPAILPGGERGPGQLDHGADQVRDLDALLLLHGRGDVLDPAPDDVELPHRGHERDHDLRLGSAAGLRAGPRPPRGSPAPAW